MNKPPIDITPPDKLEVVGVTTNYRTDADEPLHDLLNHIINILHGTPLEDVDKKIKQLTTIFSGRISYVHNISYDRKASKFTFQISFFKPQVNCAMYVKCGDPRERPRYATQQTT